MLTYGKGAPEPFVGLTPGSAVLRFTVAEGGAVRWAEFVEADTPVLERFARVQILGTQFKPEAAGRSGTIMITVTQVGREAAATE